MKFNKLAALLLASGFATAAMAGGQGGGTIEFQGEIIDAPCSVNPGSEDQIIRMGQVSNKELNGGKVAQKSQPIAIKLDSCSIDTLKSVQVTFAGTADANNPDLIGLTGSAKGAGIRLTDGSGTLVKLGQASKATQLANGDNVLNFSAAMQGSTTTDDVTPGDFRAITTFALEYK